MLEDFFMFYAPFLVVILSVAIGFWLVLKDDAVEK